MTRFFLTFVLFLTILTGREINSRASDNPISVSLNLTEQDSLLESQILYNGRVWRNLYYRVRENQFLFSPDFLRGSVTISGKFFKNVSLRYDIYNDEIMIITNHGSILQLNKEMVDSFNIIYLDRRYYFTKIQEDTLKGFTGYMNVLYSGKTSLFVKFRKEIELLAVDKKFDEFYQIHRIYFMKDGFVKLINRKKEFLNLLEDHKLQIRNFIQKNRLRISKKNPDSFLPVTEFYNSLEN